MKIIKNVSLKKYNTFGFDIEIDEIFLAQNQKDVQSFFSEKKMSKNVFFVLGEGSNVLFTDKIKDKKILKLEFQNIQKIKEDDENVWVEVESGKNWHEFVKYCVENKYSGVENLALIPGNVGGAIFGNIGAYGVEVKDVLESVKVFDIEKNKSEVFENSKCNFEYRNSLFKDGLNKNKFVILSGVFKLKKDNFDLNFSYRELKDELEKTEKPSIKDVFEKVVEIRKKKLVYPEELGNVGSFFKNPIVSKKFFETMNGFENIPFYDLKNGLVKIPAGFLIESVGLKGYRKNNVGVSEKHSLVLVNLGFGSGEEILGLVDYIKQKVFDRYGIWLEMEVEVV